MKGVRCIKKLYILDFDFLDSSTGNVSGSKVFV